MGSWLEKHADGTNTAVIRVFPEFQCPDCGDPEQISALLEHDGWESVPETDWRWIIQALNPEPDQASLPLLGRAYQGRSEVLLLRKNLEPDGRLLTIRLWDSGIRLVPGGQVLYLGSCPRKYWFSALACSVTGGRQRLTAAGLGRFANPWRAWTRNSWPKNCF